MSEPKQMPRDTRIKPRFKIAVQARIRAQLIGSSSKFDFVTENISESGLLVTHPTNFNPGFNNHTILEVWIKTDKGEEVFFFAKYVRKASESSFAINIIDIDPANNEILQEFIYGLMDTVEE